MVFDRAKYCPGIWYAMHRMAKNALTTDLQKAFCKNIRLDANSFPCKECKPHYEEYVNLNPPEANLKELFRWTWEFHNNVNTLLNKPNITYDAAVALFEEECESCTSNLMIPHVFMSRSENTALEIIKEEKKPIIINKKK
jgi:hypothetical protein